MRNKIPHEAVFAAEDIQVAARLANQAKWIRGINSFGKGVGIFGLFVSALDIGWGAYETFTTGDPKPLVKAVAHTAGGYGAALATGAVFGYVGTMIGGPVVGAAAALVGAAIGFIGGSRAVDAIIDWLW